jgi:hypothetical protein
MAERRMAMRADDYIECAATVLLAAMDEVSGIYDAVGQERAERIRSLAWALGHAASLLRRAADIEDKAAVDA